MMFFKKFGEKLKNLFGGRKINEEFFEELEDTLIEGDLGARLTDEIVQSLRDIAKKEGLTEASELQSRMKDILSQYIRSYDRMPEKGELTVYMILGVNGVGKTTTIAKMAKYYTAKGLKVLLAAGDTFRAAAVDQLDIHAERLGMRIVKQKMGSDPGAVVFDAITSAQAHGDDLILAARFQDIMLNPIAHSFLSIRKIIISGQDDKLYIIVVLSDLLYQLQTRKLGHLDVGKDNIRIFIQNGIICFQSVFTYSNDLDVQTFPVDQSTYSFTYDFFVICN